MDGVVAVGVPLALGIRLTSLVVTLMLARQTRACRWVALSGSIVASVMTAAVAVFVIGSERPIDGTLFRWISRTTSTDFLTWAKPAVYNWNINFRSESA